MSSGSGIKPGQVQTVSRVSMNDVLIFRFPITGAERLDKHFRSSWMHKGARLLTLCAISKTKHYIRQEK